jgi:hypothetical protein
MPLASSTLARAARSPPSPNSARLPQRTRGNNPGMSDLMKAITADDIAALAAYLAAL